MRTKNDKFIDMLLTLEAIRIASKFTKNITILMIQKILFLSADFYRENKLRVLSQSFYRWDYGPMSEEVYADFNSLSDQGFIQGDVTKDVHITSDGLKLLEASSELLQKEKRFIEPLEEVAKNVTKLDELLNKVYAKKVYIEEMDKTLPVDKVPEGMHILTPMWRDEAKESLVLDKAWIETLELMLVPEVDTAIRKSIEDAKKGRIRPLELD
jgi:uncharacterized protein YwgA